MKPRQISKVLSNSDIGGTVSHQAGICIPKQNEILSFFPELDKRIKNPRETIVFIDNSGYIWEFNFIYYNNKFFGGTRNEYRLTGMIPFIRKNKLKAGDTVILSHHDDGSNRIDYKRSFVENNDCEPNIKEKSASHKIVIKNYSWRAINYKRSNTI